MSGNSYILVTGKPVLLGQWPSEEDRACHYEFEWRTHVSYLNPLDELVVNLLHSMHVRQGNVVSLEDYLSS